MTKAIISDFSGNTIKDSLAYTVKIYSHGNKTHLEADMGFDMPLKTLVESFLANGCKWFKLEKQEDGKWTRIELGESQVEAKK